MSILIEEAMNIRPITRRSAGHFKFKLHRKRVINLSFSARQLLRWGILVQV